MTTLKSSREMLSINRAPNDTKQPNNPRDETPTTQAQPIEDLEMVILYEEHPNRSVKINATTSIPLNKVHRVFARTFGSVHMVV